MLALTFPLVTIGTTVIAAGAWTLLAAQSDSRPPGAPGLMYDHVHMAAPDPEKAVAWYIKHMGGVPGESEIHVRFGSRGPMPVEFPFQVQASPRPSDGGGIDNVGFSVPDVEARVRELEAAGVKIASRPRQVPGLWKQAVVEDPWGVKIELVENADRPGLHHVTLRVPDPEESLKFYVDVFGGERTKVKGRLDAIDYGNIYLLVLKGEGASNDGRAIDHIGWSPANVEAAVAGFKAKGVKFETELPKTLNARGHRTFFLAGPSGVRIQIVDHSAHLEKR
jgi:catechol 2,3-dioxygenase-like lactoylglutathione lyase family enzyme